MNVIFTDFSGVLDDKTRKSNERSLNFELPQKANVNNVVNLVRFAKKHNALILSISTYSKYVDMCTVLLRVLIHQTEEADLQEYLKNLRYDIIRLQSKLPKGKKETIDAFKKLYPDAKFVSFEDDEILKGCNQIHVDSYTGLTNQNIKDAEKFFL